MRRDICRHACDSHPPQGLRVGLLRRRLTGALAANVSRRLDAVMSAALSSESVGLPDHLPGGKTTSRESQQTRGQALPMMDHLRRGCEA